MYAKIITRENEIYDSPVLLLKYGGFSSWAVVFDKSFSKLIKIPYWNKSFGRLVGPNIQLINYDSTNYKIFKGRYKSVWNKSFDLLRCKLGLFSKKQINYAKQFLQNEKIGQYIDINTSDDLEALSDCAGDFHDGYLLEVNKEEEHEEFLFDTTWGNYVSVRTSGKRDIHMFLYETISGCTGKIIDGIKRIDLINMFDFESDEKDMYLLAEKMSYRTFFEHRIELKELTKFEVIDNMLVVNEANSIPLSNGRIIFSENEDGAELFFKAEDFIYKLDVAKKTKVIEALISSLKNMKYNVSSTCVDNFKMKEYNSKI